MQDAKWGNSLAIRLPANVVEVLGLIAGDHVEVRVVSDGGLDVQRNPTNRELLVRLRQYRGSLPADFKFDRQDANARDDNVKA